jgi:hypothetical protein
MFLMIGIGSITEPQTLDNLLRKTVLSRLFLYQIRRCLPSLLERGRSSAEVAGARHDYHGA